MEPGEKIFNNDGIQKPNEKGNLDLANWTDFSPEAANMLIETGKGWFVADQLKKFEGVNHTEIANKLIDTGQVKYVAKFIYNFEKLDRIIAEKIISKWESEPVIEHADRFVNLVFDDALAKLIARSGGKLSSYFERFNGLDFTGIANIIIDKGEGILVAKYLERYKGVNHTEIANRLIDTKQGFYVAKYFSNFKNLDLKTVDTLKSMYGYMFK